MNGESGVSSTNIKEMEVSCLELMILFSSLSQLLGQC